MPTTCEDHLEILQLLYRYNHRIDSGDAEGWAATFTAEGVLDTGREMRSGRESLVEFASNVHGLRHIVANPYVEITGDTATVDAYLVVLRGTTVRMTGIYRDEIVRTPQGWRFAKRAVTRDEPA